MRNEKKLSLTKIAVTVLIAVVLSSSTILSSGRWEKASDNDCDKCVITSLEYTCGKCGSGMSFTTKWHDEKKLDYLVYTFKCKDSKKRGCTHGCVYNYKTK